MAKSNITLKKIGSLPLTRSEKKWLRNNDEMIQIIAEDAKNHFVKGFQKGGGQTDDSLTGWKPRKKLDRKDRKSGSSSRAILVKSGDLWRDIDVQSIGRDQIKIGTKRIAYAAVHNEGLITGRRGGRFTMPKREFIGESKELNKLNTLTIKEFLDLALRT